MRGDLSKLIFIDSSVNTDGREHSKIMCPPHPFSTTQGEKMTLTLVSYTQRRNWYNINPTNNTFYLTVNNIFYEVVIQPGVYSTFASLGVAIAEALNITVTGTTEITSAFVSYDARSRLYAFQFAMAAGHTTTTVQILCFAIKSGQLPPNVTLAGGFNDVHEILGGTPTRSTAVIEEAFIGSLSGGVNTLTSKFPATLNTLDAIYLHFTSVQTGNYMSTGFESHTNESLRIIESSLFARIPFQDSAFSEAHETISYEDSGGDTFQTVIQHLETLDIRVTDARGRSLAQISPTQAESGLLSFKMVLRWDLFRAPPTRLPRSDYKLDHLPKL
jgi:hypothetical protein